MWTAHPPRLHEEAVCGPVVDWWLVDGVTWIGPMSRWLWGRDSDNFAPKAFRREIPSSKMERRIIHSYASTHAEGKRQRSERQQREQEEARERQRQVQEELEALEKPVEDDKEPKRRAANPSKKNR